MYQNESIIRLNMPATNNRIKKSFVLQHSEFYCGLACLTSIVKYHGGDTTQDKLRDISGTTLGGTSLLGLYQAAKKIGFEADGYEATPDDLKNFAEPAILHILNEAGNQHFVVFYKYENGEYTIGDPESGVHTYNEKKLAEVWKSRYLLKLVPGKNFLKTKLIRRKKIRWFNQLIKDDYPVLGIAAFLGVIVSILGLSIAVFSQRLIDDILPNKDTRTLIFGLVYLALILLASGIINYIRTVFLVRQGKDMNNRIISGFFGKILFLPKSFFQSTTVGDFVGRLNDTQRIQSVVVNLTSQVIIDVLVVITSTVYIFLNSTSTGFICLAAIPVFGLLAWKYNRQIISAQREVMKSYAITESKFIDTIGGINTIKTYNQENFFSKSVNYVYRFFMDKIYHLGILGAKLNFWITAYSALFIIGLLSWMTFLVLEGQLQLGQMMAIVTLIGGFTTSVVSVAMANIQIQEARIAFERMFEFASSEPEYQSHKREEKSDRINIENIQVDKLNFRFPGKSLLLENLSFEIKKGEIVTFFGEIGCGKSTLLGILQRFFQFESGIIKVNGKDWSGIKIKDWRNEVASVSQHVHLFNGTIFENIAINEEPDYDKLTDFCKKYGFHDFIEEFQQGYATIVNENSTNLSGGQRQLVSLARAIYSNPQVLLLDEATAAMDRKSEHFVIDLLNKIKKNMAIIFVTHRPQLARHTNRIYVVENRTISDFGTHDYLIKTNQFYKQAFLELMI